MTEKTLWHIAAADDQGVPRLGYRDDREIKVGETLTVAGELELCEYGLHACPDLYDCLGYARGTVICKVTLGDEVLAPKGENKVVSNARTVIAMTTAEDGERILREFARWCALQVIDLWNPPDVVRQYLESGDESLGAAAGAAAWTAAGDAAGDAAWTTAWTTAGDAARDAARAAAWTTAWTTAGDAARAAAWAAAWAAARAAAWAAARAAAWDTKMQEFRSKLAEMVEEHFSAITALEKAST